MVALLGACRGAAAGEQQRLLGMPGLAHVQQLHSWSLPPINTANAPSQSAAGTQLVQLRGWPEGCFGDSTASTVLSVPFPSPLAAHVLRRAELSHQRVSRLQPLPGARVPRPGPC